MLSTVNIKQYERPQLIAHASLAVVFYLLTTKPRVLFAGSLTPEINAVLRLFFPLRVPEPMPSASLGVIVHSNDFSVRHKQHPSRQRCCILRTVVVCSKTGAGDGCSACICSCIACWKYVLIKWHAISHISHTHFFYHMCRSQLTLQLITSRGVGHRDIFFNDYITVLNYCCCCCCSAVASQPDSSSEEVPKKYCSSNPAVCCTKPKTQTGQHGILWYIARRVPPTL